jgi:hypothetical protein
LTDVNSYGFAAALALGITVLATDAAAQDASLTYFVVTNDGSTYQGQLVENVVGQHTTIRLVSGEIRTFQAGDVKSQGPVGGGNVVVPTNPTLTPEQQAALTQIAQLRAQALAQSMTPTPGSPGAPPVTYTGPDAVQIHVTKANDSEGTLLGETASGWQPVCTMPCTTTVDPKVDYKLTNSGAFRFPAGKPLDLIADTGHHRVFVAIGWTMIGVSLVSWLPGLAFQLSGPGMARTPAEMQQQQQQQSSNTAAALAFYIGSGVLLVAGIIITNIHPASTLVTADGLRLVKRSPKKPFTLTPTGLAF